MLRHNSLKFREIFLILPNLPKVFFSCEGTKPPPASGEHAVGIVFDRYFYLRRIVFQRSTCSHTFE